MNQSISRLWCTKMKAERMVHEGVKYKGAIQILKSFFMLKKDTPRLGFEPRQRDPNSLVLPLHYLGIETVIIYIEGSVLGSSANFLS